MGEKYTMSLKVAEFAKSCDSVGQEDFFDDIRERLEIVATRIAWDRGSTKKDDQGQEFALVEAQDFSAAMAELRHAWKIVNIDYETTISSGEECHNVLARFYADASRTPEETLRVLRKLRDELTSYVKLVESEIERGEKV